MGSGSFPATLVRRRCPIGSNRRADEWVPAFAGMTVAGATIASPRIPRLEYDHLGEQHRVGRMRDFG
jgi:hypothetical protein